MSEEDGEAAQGNRTPSIYRKAGQANRTQETHTSPRKTRTQGLSDLRPESEDAADADLEWSNGKVKADATQDESGDLWHGKPDNVAAARMAPFPDIAAQSCYVV